MLTDQSEHSSEAGEHRSSFFLDRVQPLQIRASAVTHSEPRSSSHHLARVVEVSYDGAECRWEKDITEKAGDSRGNLAGCSPVLLGLSHPKFQVSSKRNLRVPRT